ncbi:MAG: thymidylate synthase [Pseudodesulfovibrio sp.]|uniref:thymidylate synthase n=1 Tax=Pseudodesulfovibrio sp. TaxID=2035812 RepID=UPI003D1027B6
MCKVFIGNTADQVWIDAINALNASDQAVLQNSRLGGTREILHVNFHVKEPQQRWVLSRLPAINPAFAIVETLWILGGLEDSALVNYWNPMLPRFAGNGPTYYGAYGFRIRKQYGFDQLDRAFYGLLNNPDSRQIVIQIWDPRSDFPGKDGKPMSEDIPCNICALPKIRDGKLEWLQVMRSNDLYRGTPYNIVQFTTMQEVLAGWLGVKVGAYHQISDCLHVYDSDLAELKWETSPIDIRNEDSLALSRSDFDEVLNELLSYLYEFTSPEMNSARFVDVVTRDTIPISYRNLLAIAACDSARRRGWRDELSYARKQCRNELLLAAWDRWEARYPL